MNKHDPFVTYDFRDDSVEPILPAIDPGLGLKYLQPYFGSGPAIANKSIFYSSPTAFKKAAGDINIKQHGHSGTLIQGSLAAGAGVYACKLMPNDAVKSTIKLCIAIRQKSIIQYERDEYGNFKLVDGNRVPKQTTDEIPVDVTASGYEIKRVIKVCDDPANVDAIETIAADEGGASWTLYPIIYGESDGVGKRGDDWGFNITIDPTRDGKFPDGRRYAVEFFSKNDRGVITTFGDSFNSLSFSFNPNAVQQIGSKTLDIFDTNFKTYKKAVNLPLTFDLFEDNVLTLLTKLDEVFDNDIFDIDFLFGLDKDGVGYDKIVVSEDSDPLGASGYPFLLGGSDGSLGLGNTVKGSDGSDIVVTPEIIKATQEQLLVEFYRGNIDDNIFDTRIVDALHTFDALFPTPVKLAMVGDFPSVRDNIKIYVDCGKATSLKDAMNNSKAIIQGIDPNNGQNVVINIMTYGYTKNLERNIKTTGNYEIATSLPYYYNSYYPFVVHAGYYCGKIRNMEFDFYPKIVRNNLQIKPIKDANLLFAMRLDNTDNLYYMSDDNLYNTDFSVRGSRRNTDFENAVAQVFSKVLVKKSFFPGDVKDSIDNINTELDEIFGKKYFTQCKIGIEYTVYQTKEDVIDNSGRITATLSFPGILQKFKITIHSKRKLPKV